MQEDFERALANNIFTQTSEKSFSDKVLGRADVEKVGDIIKKDRLTREDLMYLMYMLSSVEVKLFNYGEWDRYVMAKYFVWIRDFVALYESLIDYKQDLEKKEKKGDFSISPRTWQIFENNIRLTEHNIKFLIDLYFNLGRSTMSLGATGFLELLKNKFELFYPQQANKEYAESQQQKMVNFKWKR